MIKEMRRIMNSRELLDILQVAERLKDTTRHCYTSQGRHESVAEHTWMMTLMALLLEDELTDIDMAKVIKMCLIHDLGECFTGDIPTFDKTAEHEAIEHRQLSAWLNSLPQKTNVTLTQLFNEMNARETPEAKTYKALDSLEALIQHNLSDLDAWSENEFDLNLVYADDKVGFSNYLTELREEIRTDTIKKISNSDKKRD